MDNFEIQYHEGDGGDVIVGTKSQIQALGLGIGRAFPGEPGGPSRGRALQLRDPLGRTATVRRLGAARFVVRIELGGFGSAGGRPPRLRPLFATAVSRHYARALTAAQDSRFQAVLARLVADAVSRRTA